MIYPQISVCILEREFFYENNWPTSKHQDIDITYMGFSFYIQNMSFSYDIYGPHTVETFEN